MSDKVKKLLQIVVGLIFLITASYFTLQGIDFVALKEAMLNADYTYIFLPIPIILLSHYMRAFRWNTMLKPIVKDAKVWDLFSSVMIGYAANNIITRSGEFLRPYIISKKENISYSSTLATILLERVIDVITLVLLFGLTFVLLGDQILNILPKNEVGESYLDPNSLITIIGLLVIIALLNLYPPFINWILKITIKPISIKLYEKLLGIVDRFKKGFAIVKKPKMYVKLSIESAIIWFLYALPMFIMFYAFDFQAEFNLGMKDAMMIVIVAGIAVTIAPVPGAVGVYHLAVSIAMVNLYEGLNREEALAYATVVHALNYILQLIVGGLFFFKENIKSIKPKQPVESTS